MEVTLKQGRLNSSSLLRLGLNWSAVLFTSFLLAPFSELRTINYSLSGQRTISIAMVLFLFVVTIDFFRALRDIGSKHMLQKLMPVAYLMGALALFMLHKILFWAVLPYTSPTALYTLGGVTIVMVLSFFSLAKYGENEILVFVFQYCLVMALFLLVVYLSARLFNFNIVYQGPDIVSLPFPYFFRPYQAATLGAIVLILGSGAAISLGRRYILYFIVPVLVLAVAQTGCRSVMWLLTSLWLIMLVYYALNRNLIPVHTRASLSHLLLSTILAAALLALFIDEQSLRAVSFLFSNPLNLLTATADAPRHGMWLAALKSYFYGTPFPIIGQGSLHNVYLDILINGGLVALMFFVLFIGLMIHSVAKLTKSNKASLNQPMYMTLLMALLLIVGEFYANPMLSFPFVWMSFGLILALLSINRLSKQ